MTRALQAGRVEPQSGETRSALIFLHGYGANGADLLGLAEPLGEHMPDTLFLAPDAPAWDDASNNKWLVSGNGSMIWNPPSAWAVAVRDAPDIAQHLWTHGAPAGPRTDAPR